MAPISEVVNVNVKVQAATITRAGFGTPLIAGYHTHGGGPRVATFTSIADMLTYGFAATDVLVRAAGILLAQSPKIPSFKVGKCLLPATQKVNFTPTDTTVGTVYSIKFTKPDGTTATATYPVAPSDTLTLITTGLQAAVAALSLATSQTNHATNFDVTATAAGTYFDMGITGPLSVHDITVDPGIATDLAAINLEDPNWYGLGLDVNGEAMVAAAATWVLANGKWAEFDTIDTACGTSSTSDIGSTLQTATNTRCGLNFGANLLHYTGIGAMGVHFSTSPGRATLNLKKVAGVAVPFTNATQRGYFKAKRINFLVTFQGLNVYLWGTFASGYADNQRFLDALTAGMGEDLFAYLANNDKIPFTDLGGDGVRSTISATLAGFTPFAIDDKKPIVVSVPPVDTISSIDKGNRLLSGTTFSAQLTGAIHEIKSVDGTISV